MSQENLDLVRSIYADWERGDFSTAEWADPEIEFVIADGTDPGVWTGIAGLAGAWREVLSVWDDLRMEVENYRPLDDERVLALPTWTGRARTSGLDLAEMPWTGASLFHMREGKVVRLVLYWDREHALTDLGLAE
jgi:ketosteroid isomerase-like protein